MIKDDTGAADVTKRLAQELIGNDHAIVLMGFGLTPLALAVGAGRDRSESARNRHRRRDRDDHREVALHRAHLLHAAAGRRADGRVVR